MTLRVAISLCALLGLPAMVLGADRTTENAASYRDIALQCGEGPSKRHFSSSEYEAAIGAAQSAKKAARGNRVQTAAVQLLLDKLNECREEAARNIPIPPIRNCDDLISEHENFLERVVELRYRGTITYDDATRMEEGFRKPLQDCIRDLFSKCVDPTKTSDVDRVRMVAFIARHFGLVHPTGEDRFDRFLTNINPNRLQLKFCNDTDFACKGAPKACRNRTDDLKKILQEYFDN